MKCKIYNLNFLVLFFSIFLTSACTKFEYKIPVVYTISGGLYHPYDAKCKYEIRWDGGKPILERGICWGTNPYPTVDDKKIIDVENYYPESILSTPQLELNTNYYIRPYATNVVGTAYGDQISFTTSRELSVGFRCLGGAVAYVFQSGDSGYVSGETHGIIVALSDQSALASYGCFDILSGAIESAIGTGKNNTMKIIASDPTAGIAARICDDLTIDGYSDWFLPSKDELDKTIANLGYLNFSNIRYWSSTEVDIHYASIHNRYSNVTNWNKNSFCAVRAIRYF